MPVERDYYEVLGIPRDADPKTIKDAYHRLAMKWHPDRNKSPEAESRFKEIAKAYAILSKPDKRAQYDAHGFEGVAHFSEEDLFRNVDLGSLFGDLGFGFGPGGSSIFDRLFGEGLRRGPTRGPDLRINLELALKRIAAGGPEDIVYHRPVTCPACHGYGTASGKPPVKCRACNGTGHQIKTRRDSGREGQTISFQQILNCPECHGRGAVIESRCKRCGGDGQTTKEEKLRLQIPAGIEDGMTLRVPGHGLPGGGDAEPGDLHVVIYTAPDPRFQRRGADLWRSEIIQIADAVLGANLTVPTLDGNVEVKLPAGTQPNEVLRLRGKGLPRFGQKGNGDINLRIQIHIPDDISWRERKLFKELRELRKH
jgi:molecular chaperone DnaJ